MTKDDAEKPAHMRSGELADQATKWLGVAAKGGPLGHEGGQAEAMIGIGYTLLAIRAELRGYWLEVDRRQHRTGLEAAADSRPSRGFAVVAAVETRVQGAGGDRRLRWRIAPL